jgi:type VI secretion system protein ImpF
VSRGDPDIRVTLSVLDRLLDDDPENSRDAFQSRWESVREFRRSVHRDLDHLLNTRNPHADLKPGFKEVWQSVLVYGMPDFLALNILNDSGLADLREQVATALRRFEPRLADVSVTVELEKTDDKDKRRQLTLDRSLRLRVDALLQLNPEAEPIVFDIVMPLNTNKYEVRRTD